MNEFLHLARSCPCLWVAQHVCRCAKVYSLAAQRGSSRTVELSDDSHIVVVRMTTTLAQFPDRFTKRCMHAGGSAPSCWEEEGARILEALAAIPDEDLLAAAAASVPGTALARALAAVRAARTRSARGDGGSGGGRSRGGHTSGGANQRDSVDARRVGFSGSGGRGVPLITSTDFDRRDPWSRYTDPWSTDTEPHSNGTEQRRYMFTAIRAAHFHSRNG